MKASAFEFRFRYLIHTVIYTLGFTTPWNHWLHLDAMPTWRVLTAGCVRTGMVGFGVATVLVLVVGILFATAAAGLRTWAAAYLGSGIVQDSSMHGDHMVAAGPYRHMRNPLYVGTFLHTLALALLMQPSGAIFCIVTIGLLQARLIGGEEVFLAAKLGEPYREYCGVVPRLVPSLRPKVAESLVQPRWGLGFLGEIYMWGVVASFLVFVVAVAAYGRYDTFLIIQGVVISLGVSLVARAFVPKPQKA